MTEMMYRLLGNVGNPAGIGILLTSFATGTYTGDGSATQVIGGIGFQPILVLIYPQDDAARSGQAFKMAGDGANASVYQSGFANGWRYGADHVISLDADGFTVGDGTPLGVNLCNVKGRVYAYVCWGPLGSVGVNLVVGSYTGDGNATQAIIGVGFQPRLVIIYALSQPAAGEQPIFYKCNQDGLNAVFHWAGGAGRRYLTDVVISLDADGFTIGDMTGWPSNLINALGIVYSYLCWG